MLVLYTQLLLVVAELVECQIPMATIPQPLALLLLVAVEAVEMVVMDLVGLVDQAVAEMVRVAAAVLVILHPLHQHKVTVVDLAHLFQP
jgi:hypothetical protein